MLVSVFDSSHWYLHLKIQFPRSEGDKSRCVILHHHDQLTVPAGTANSKNIVCDDLSVVSLQATVRIFILVSTIGSHKVYTQ